MELLPPLDARESLLERMSELVGLRGWEHFILAPLIEPDARYFPEPWKPTAAGVRLLSRRLLTYADLGQLEAQVTLFDEFQGEGDAVAWFAGIEGKRCIFGARVDQLKMDDTIVGAMCHEVAHAYRTHHRVQDAPRAYEEEQTDLTTVYLGFGILTLNNTYLHRSRAFGASGTGLSVSVSGAGYLSTQSMAFLLAVQATARQASAAERRHIASLLEANQAACFQAACKELAKAPGEVADRLRLPPKEQWPPPRSLRLQPIVDLGPEPEAPAARPPVGRGGVAFAVRRTRALSRAALGAVVGVIVGAVAARWLGGVAMLGPPVVGLLVGRAWGKRKADYFCSEQDCGAALTEGARSCPKCGSMIGGIIASENDRLTAAEELEEQEAKTGPSSQAHLVPRARR
jgi:hypothetical protein